MKKVTLGFQVIEIKGPITSTNGEINEIEEIILYVIFILIIH